MPNYIFIAVAVEDWFYYCFNY